MLRVVTTKKTENKDKIVSRGSSALQKKDKSRKHSESTARRKWSLPQLGPVLMEYVLDFNPEYPEL